LARIPGASVESAIQSRPLTGEDGIDEFVASLAIGAVVGGIVQLDDQARSSGTRIAEYEIDALGLTGRRCRQLRRLADDAARRRR
jgi:hypothetical protein